MSHGIDSRGRWLALTVLCLGVLMIVLDTTIVNVALPSIRDDLGFSETSLVWVVNAYMLTFGGGLLLAAAGLALFARMPVDGIFLVDVLPGMLLMGVGAGIAFNPMLLAAMNDVAPDEAGLASGVVNTSFMMGGALGLAVLAALAAARTGTLLAGGVAERAALNGGYQLAFAAGAVAATLAAVLGAALIRPAAAPAAPAAEPREELARPSAAE
ncbi:hypothetical protein CDO44_07295 [Pigmentiphaga sp. NML080357]|nr:hypothetical protein [Pigmentiphaga sp. NML080357]OVZ61014.1 hypothetical protein CDO44_07295 [Pigmentiphaga sp. NML080357]